MPTLEEIIRAKHGNKTEQPQVLEGGETGIEQPKVTQNIGIDYSQPSPLSQPQTQNEEFNQNFNYLNPEKGFERPVYRPDLNKQTLPIRQQIPLRPQEEQNKNLFLDYDPKGLKKIPNVNLDVNNEGITQLNKSANNIDRAIRNDEYFKNAYHDYDYGLTDETPNDDKIKVNFALDELKRENPDEYSRYMSEAESLNKERSEIENKLKKNKGNTSMFSDGFEKGLNAELDRVKKKQEAYNKKINTLAQMTDAKVQGTKLNELNALIQGQYADELKKLNELTEAIKNTTDEQQKQVLASQLNFLVNGTKFGQALQAQNDIVSKYINTISKIKGIESNDFYPALKKQAEKEKTALDEAKGDNWLKAGAKIVTSEIAGGTIQGLGTVAKVGGYYLGDKNKYGWTDAFYDDVVKFIDEEKNTTFAVTDEKRNSITGQTLSVASFLIPLFGGVAVSNIAIKGGEKIARKGLEKIIGKEGIEAATKDFANWGIDKAATESIKQRASQFASQWVLTHGQTYNELIDAGLDQKTAMEGANRITTIVSAISMVSPDINYLKYAGATTQALVKNIAKGGKLTKSGLTSSLNTGIQSFGKNLSRELPEEVAQTIVEINQKNKIYKETGLYDRVQKDISKDIENTIIITTILSGMHGVGGVVKHTPMQAQAVDEALKNPQAVIDEIQKMLQNGNLQETEAENLLNFLHKQGEYEAGLPENLSEAKREKISRLNFLKYNAEQKGDNKFVELANKNINYIINAKEEPKVVAEEVTNPKIKELEEQNLALDNELDKHINDYANGIITQKEYNERIKDVNEKRNKIKSEIDNISGVEKEEEPTNVDEKVNEDDVPQQVVAPNLEVPQVVEDKPESVSESTPTDPKNKRLARLNKDLEEYKQKLQELEDGYDNGSVEREKYIKQKNKLKKDISDINEEIKEKEAELAKDKVVDNAHDQAEKELADKKVTRKTHKEAVEWVKENEEKIINDYLAKHGNKLDPDEVRKHFEQIGYDGTNVDDYRAAEKKIVGTLFEKMLDAAEKSGNKTITFLTGVGGAGKSNIVKNLDLSKKGAIFDGAFNSFEKLDAFLSKAKEKGFEIEVIAVHNDPITAFKNSLERGIKTGRFLGIGYFTKAFTKNHNKVNEITKKYPDVKIKAFDNSGNNTKEVSVDEAKNWNYKLTDEQIEELLQIINDDNRLEQNQLAAVGSGLQKAIGLAGRRTDKLVGLSRQIEQRIGGIRQDAQGGGVGVDKRNEHGLDEKKEPHAEPRISEAEQRRKNGKFSKDGVTYNRQGKDVVKHVGKEGTVKFSDKGSGKDVPFTYALIEAEHLQPSHKNGTRNQEHFIPEAQPKERTDAASKKASDNISKNFDLNEAGENATAYSGAPIVNERGEVIQGNNRSEGILKNYASSEKSVKDQLSKNAEKFGFTKEQVEEMKEPVLVRVAKVEDSKAIELGNYTVADVESGGNVRIDKKNVSGKMPSKAKAKLLGILSTGDLSSLNQIIRSKTKEILKVLKDYINETQYQSLLNSNGEFKKTAIEDIEGLANEFLFANGSIGLEEKFNSLPHNTKEGIRKSLVKVYSTKKSNDILPELQSAISILGDFYNSGIENFENFISQQDMFAENAEQFGDTEINIAKTLLEAKTQKEIVNAFSHYNELVSGKEANLLEEAKKPESKKSAAEKAFKKNNLPFHKTDNVNPTTKKIFNKVVDKIKKAFPTVNIISDFEKGKKRLEELKDSEIKYFNDNNGETYGFLDPETGDIYIDPNHVNSNTPIHEAGHLWAQVYKKQFPDLHKKMIDNIIANKEAMDTVRNDENYSHLTTDEEIADELLARTIGNIGEKKVNEKFNAPFAKKIADFAKNILGKIKEFLGKSNPNIQKWKTQDFIEKATLNDIAEAVSSDILSGRKMFDKKAIAEAFQTVDEIVNNAHDQATQTAFQKAVDLAKKVVNSGKEKFINFAGLVDKKLNRDIIGEVREKLIAEIQAEIKATNEKIKQNDSNTNNKPDNADNGDNGVQEPSTVQETTGTNKQGADRAIQEEVPNERGGVGEEKAEELRAELPKAEEVGGEKGQRQGAERLKHTELAEIFDEAGIEIDDTYDIENNTQLNIDARNIVDEVISKGKLSDLADVLISNSDSQLMNDPTYPLSNLAVRQKVQLMAANELANISENQTNEALKQASAKQAADLLNKWASDRTKYAKALGMGGNASIGTDYGTSMLPTNRMVAEFVFNKQQEEANRKGFSEKENEAIDKETSKLNKEISKESLTSQVDEDFNKNVDDKKLDDLDKNLDDLQEDIEDC